MTYQNGSTSFGRRGTQKAVEAPRVKRADVEDIEISAGMILMYVGHNSHRYEAVVDALDSKKNNFRGTAFSWCWGAFFFSPLWLVYRRRWAAAGAMIFIEMIVGYMFPQQSYTMLPFHIVFAAMAKGLYVNSAASRIKRILLNETNAARAAVSIRDAGGVSPGSVWVVLGLYAVFIVMLMMVLMAARPPV